MKNIGKCKKWRILACIGILCMLFACADHMLQDDERSTTRRSKNKNRELTSSAAKEWFESNYAPVVTTRTSGGEGKELAIKPYWDKAKESNRGRFEVVETPTLSKGMHIILDEETTKHWQPGMKADYIRNTTKMVVLKDLVTNKTRSFIMVFVGSYDYLTRSRNMGRNSYLYREPDYDGMVLYYAINGTFINGWRYSNGKLVGYISPSYNEQGESSAQTRGYYDCHDVHTTEYRQDCHDEYELVGGDMETGLIYDIVNYCDYIPYTTSYQDCHYVEDSTSDNDDDDNWWNNPYPPGGAGNETNPVKPGSNNSPKAKKIFRNSNMTEANWKVLEKMLDKILADCMGEALYNGLANFLNGQTLTIQFSNGSDGLFSGNGATAGITLGSQMESNQLFHEMMHAYRAYQETLSSYKGSNMNGEIEAWYAQYLYTSRLPEYPGSKWEERDNTDPRRVAIKNLTNIIDNKGNIRSGASVGELELEIANTVVPTFHENYYPADKYPFDYDRPGLENFTNLKKLTINC